MALHKLSKSYSSDFRLPNKKPVGDVEIDWSNKLTTPTGGKGDETGESRLASLWLFQNGLESKEYIHGGSGDSYTWVASDGGSPPNFGVGVKGKRAEFIPSGACVNFSPAINLGNAFTISALVDFPLPYSLAGVASQNILRWNGSTLDFVGAAITLDPSTLSGAHRITVTAEFGGAAGERYNFYLDGSLVGTDATGDLPTARFLEGIGNNNSDLNRSRGTVLYDFFRWENVALDAGAVREHAINPYQVLKPKNDPVYFTSDAAGGTITVSPTLGTISYSGNATTIGLFGSIDVTATLGAISYAGNNTTVGLFGVVDVTAGLGTISYTSNATTVQVSGSVDVTATLGAISYTSNDTVVDLGGAITVAAGLGSINYVSNDTIVGLAGQIGINATLGTISYTSNNTIVIASNGQSIGDVNTSFAGDLYGSNFKPNSITVTFRG